MSTNLNTISALLNNEVIKIASITEENPLWKELVEALPEVGTWVLRPGKIVKKIQQIRKDLAPQAEAWLESLSCKGIAAKQNKLTISLSMREEDIEAGTTAFRSCLSPGGCNRDTVESHKELRTVIVAVKDEGGNFIGRKWLVWDGGMNWSPEPVWYGNLSPETGREIYSLLVEILEGEGMTVYPQTPPVHPEFEGWLDSYGHRLSPEALIEEEPHNKWVFALLGQQTWQGRCQIPVYPPPCKREWDEDGKEYYCLLYWEEWNELPNGEVLPWVR
jgi:hypothetical protein